MMPDLSLSACRQYWESYQDSIVIQALSLMESAEQWTLDNHDEVENALEQLGNHLNDLEKVNLKDKDKIIQVITHLKATRFLYILQILDKAYPGAASEIIGHAEKNRNNDAIFELFLKRNLIFERFRLAARVLAPSRLDTLIQALEEKDHG
jgi:hypothetical protein